MGDVVPTDWEILSNEADIFGSVFVDCDCDVQKDTDDNGIGNVVVTLTGDSSCAVSSLSATTSSAGDYSFIGLPPCTYTVSIPSTTGQFCSTSGSSQTVTLSSTSLFNVNFGIEGANTFTVPADASVFCNQGTSPSTLGSATSSSCGASGTVSFADTRSSLLPTLASPRPSPTPTPRFLMSLWRATLALMPTRASLASRPPTTARLWW